jgi:hypothetical protein
MPKLEAKLVAAAEHCCVVLQTLRNGVPATVELNNANARPQPATPNNDWGNSDGPGDLEQPLVL